MREVMERREERVRREGEQWRIERWTREARSEERREGTTDVNERWQEKEKEKRTRREEGKDGTSKEGKGTRRKEGSKTAGDGRQVVRAEEVEEGKEDRREKVGSVEQARREMERTRDQEAKEGEEREEEEVNDRQKRQREREEREKKITESRKGLRERGSREAKEWEGGRGEKDVQEDGKGGKEKGEGRGEGQGKVGERIGEKREEDRRRSLVWRGVEGKDREERLWRIRRAVKNTIGRDIEIGEIVERIGERGRVVVITEIMEEEDREETLMKADFLRAKWGLKVDENLSMEERRTRWRMVERARVERSRGRR
ncbi:PREDICTED: DEAD-box ATP-dependent RNA helicase 42-like, partial [Vollenhovia emeryi]|uniref:DEAD-box ATP-dependent RNA helicase 42-like n=1 Tax=Vollenhovia emeryi TaxID=411798 RepID=UPI0005F4834E